MATDETIDIIIDAEDRATAQVRKTTKDIQQQVGAVKELGGKAKASTELVGTLASTLGGGELGQGAAMLAQITERVSAFSDVAKEGGKAALFFKAGLIGAVGVISFQVGRALGDLVFDTKRWREELEKAKTEFDRLTEFQLQLHQKRFDRELALIDLRGDREVELTELLIKKRNELSDVSDKITRDEARTADSLLGFMLDAIEGRAALRDQAERDLKVNKEVRDQLRKQVELLQDETSVHAKLLQQERERVQEAERLLRVNQQAAETLRRMQAQAQADRKAALAAGEAAAARVKAQQDAIHQATIRTTDQLRLQVTELIHGKDAARRLGFQLQGFLPNDIEALVKAQRVLDDIRRKPEPEADQSAPGLTGRDSRLLSGQTTSPQMKIVSAVQKTEQLTKDQLDVLKDLAKVLKRRRDINLQIQQIGP